MIVRWSPLAIERIGEIGDWIASERPAAAGRIVNGLFDAAERLKEFPLRGRRVPEFEERTDLREILIDVLTVRHTLQLMDPRSIDE
ncbi:type II toxin-antitoxin system RelE/ParE family toxin [soil metagenome]